MLRGAIDENRKFDHIKLDTADIIIPINYFAWGWLHTKW
jgi:hypothetical protein